MSKILVGCHFRQIIVENGQVKNHWLGEFIYDIIKLNGLQNVSIDTIDNNPNPNFNKATFIEDSFSIDFIQKHIEEYNIVIYPDCGGDWVDLMIKKDITEIINLILNINLMTKTGGMTLFSKFVEGITPEIISSILNDQGINSHVYDLDEKKYGYAIKFLVITK